MLHVYKNLLTKNNCAIKKFTMHVVLLGERPTYVHWHGLEWAHSNNDMASCALLIVVCKLHLPSPTH